MDQFAFDWYERAPLQKRPPRPRKPQSDRLFFAVLLGDQAAGVARLATLWCREFGLTGAVLAPERMHMSLWSFEECPSVDAELAERVCSVAAGIAFRPVAVAFDSVLSLGRVGGKSPFVLRARDGAASLHQLRSAIESAMAAVLPAQIRQPQGFEPHVKLLDDSRVVEEHIVEPVRVTVQDFALLHGRPGRGGYTVLGRWPVC